MSLGQGHGQLGQSCYSTKLDVRLQMVSKPFCDMVTSALCVLDNGDHEKTVQVKKVKIKTTYSVNQSNCFNVFDVSNICCILDVQCIIAICVVVKQRKNIDSWKLSSCFTQYLAVCQRIFQCTEIVIIMMKRKKSKRTTPKSVIKSCDNR